MNSIIHLTVFSNLSIQIIYNIKKNYFTTRQFLSSEHEFKSCYEQNLPAQSESLLSVLLCDGSRPYLLLNECVK